MLKDGLTENEDKNERFHQSEYANKLTQKQYQEYKNIGISDFFFGKEGNTNFNEEIKATINKFASLLKLTDGTPLVIDKKEFGLFRDLVLKKGFYEFFLKELDNRGQIVEVNDIPNIPKSQLPKYLGVKSKKQIDYNEMDIDGEIIKKKKRDRQGKTVMKTKMVDVYFDTKREYAKNAMFVVLFSDYKTIQGRQKKDYEIFKSLFPSITAFSEAVKDLGREKDKKRAKKGEEKISHIEFSKLLQNIESGCILDYVTRTIAQEKPQMFLATIHDSIATTPENYDYLKNRTYELIEEYMGFKPVLHDEAWEVPEDFEKYSPSEVTYILKDAFLDTNRLT